MTVVRGNVARAAFDSLGLRLGRPSDMLVIMRVLIYESVPEVAQSFVGHGMLKTTVGQLHHRHSLNVHPFSQPNPNLYNMQL